MRQNLLYIFLSLYSFFSFLSTFAQCPDFTNLTDSSVTCHYGSTYDPFQYAGIASGRHTVIDMQGSDPKSGHQLPFLPPGESKVVKLGNEQVGAAAEAITYTFTVDPDYAVLLLKFAVVMEDPGHPHHAQPRFVVRVTDQNDEVVETCAEYDVSAAAEIPGFQSYFLTRWRPWTDVGIDLSHYSGQQIRLQFVTYDCAYHGHFGYAYFTAKCMSSKLALEGCDGDNVTLTAPGGFEGYQWDNGSTSQSSTYAVDGTTYANCLIRSATGCEFTLSATILSETTVTSTGTVLYDTICEGETYNNNGFSITPEYYSVGTSLYRSTFFDAANCSGGDATNSLYLTVKQTYYHIDDAACVGDDYNKYGFQYANLQTGTIYDTITKTRPDDCDSVILLKLTVNPRQLSSVSIIGPESACDNVLVTYHLSGLDTMPRYNWTIPEGTVSYSNLSNSSISICFTDQVASPAYIHVTDINGCSPDSEPFAVLHNPSYHLFFNDTICTGMEYHEHGFHVPMQDSVGVSTFIERFHTNVGCDSVHVLQLLVSPTPSVEVLAQPEEICSGGVVAVHALGENSVVKKGKVPNIAVGDIFCTDSTVVKPSDWPVEGKTAKGIVLYEDIFDDFDGWGYKTLIAINLHQIDNVQFAVSPWDTISPYGSLPATGTPRLIIKDDNFALSWVSPLVEYESFMEGADPTSYPAYNSLPQNGWYLPTAAMLHIMSSEAEILNNSLQIVGGTPLPTLGNDASSYQFWSCEENDAKTMWVVGLSGAITKKEKSSTASVRGITYHSYDWYDDTIEIIVPEN